MAGIDVGTSIFKDLSVFALEQIYMCKHPPFSRCCTLGPGAVLHGMFSMPTTVFHHVHSHCKVLRYPNHD